MQTAQAGPAVRRIAVVGAGAAGTLAAAQLLRQAAQRRFRCEVWLIDPGDLPGRGVAYSTADPRHLLNVPSGRMSAFPQDPDHFVRWLSARRASGCGPGEFAPRLYYGAYLGDVLEEAAALAETAVLKRVRARAVGTTCRRGRIELLLNSGAVLSADAAVLAVGAFPPSVAHFPAALRRSPLFVADPWRPGARAGIPASGDVLLVGTGLTMADLAVTLAGPRRAVHAISRHALVPAAHRQDPVSVPEPPDFGSWSGLADLRRRVLLHIAAVRRASGDWRPAVDSLRPVTAALWQKLSPQDRAAFLEEDLRAWDVHRHRLAPPTARRLDSLLRTGAVEVGPAEVLEAVAEGRRLRVHLSDGRILSVSAVVNCTGPRVDLGSGGNPLIDDLLACGVARPGPLKLGLDTYADGALVPADNRTRTAWWALGALRYGTLFETTAMAEIRCQAREAAASILSSLAARTAGAGLSDARG